MEFGHEILEKSFLLIDWTKFSIQMGLRTGEKCLKSRLKIKLVLQSFEICIPLWPRGNMDASSAGGFGLESFIFLNFLLQL
jgi:hypothetical protein